MLPPTDPSQSASWPGDARHALIFRNVYQLLEDESLLEWQPFFPGVQIHWVYRAPNDGPAAAFIKFQPGARVPLHEHLGFEHIFILRGSQTDGNGMQRAGGLMVHAPGTSHSIFSEEGCLVLAIYEKRGRFTTGARAEYHGQAVASESLIQTGSAEVSDPANQPAEVLLAVNGTLMRGLELNPNLLTAGGRFVRETKTEPAYRLWSIADHHPAMVRVVQGGAAVSLEVWSIPAIGLATILQKEPPGLSIGKVKLADSSEVLGVLGEPALCEGHKEITQYGGWRAYLHTRG